MTNRGDSGRIASNAAQDDPLSRRYEADNAAMYYQRPDGTAVPIHSRPDDQQPQYHYPQPHGRPYGNQPPPGIQPPLVPPPAASPPHPAPYNLPPPKPSPSIGPFQSPTDKKQHLVVRILRVLFIVFQLVALLAGIALAIAGSVWYRGVRKRGLHTTFFGTLPMYAIGAGVALTLLSCIGLVSAITRGKSGAVIYSLLLAFLIGSQAWLLWRTGRLHDRQIMSFVSGKWDEMSEKQRKVLQGWRKCCGFGGPDDRAAEPCPPDAGKGCAVPIRTVLRRWASSIAKGLAVSMAVEFILIVLALVISFSRPKYPVVQSAPY